MDLRASFRKNREDLAVFGPSFLLRHLGRLRADRIGSVQIQGFGRICLRCCESDAQVIRQVFGAREYDTAHPPALNARLRERYDAILASGRKPIIVDAGANIGAATIWFNTIYPKARIVAVEPDAENAEILRRNTDGRANVTVVEAAIGSSPGFVTLSNPELSWGITSTRSTSGLRIMTMPEAFAASGGDVPFLVKIDIEGFESDLFASNLEWLSETFAITIEPHDWLFPGQRTSGTLQRAMAQHLFEMFIRGENLFYVRA